MAKKIDKRALSILSEKAESFTIEDLDGKEKKLYLYPLQLGRLAMISERLIDLELALTEDAESEVQKMWKICAEKPREVAEIIAIATLRTKDDIEQQLDSRIDLILHSPSMIPDAIANVFMAIVFMSYYSDFISAIRSVKTFAVRISPTTEMERIASMEDKPSGDR